ncbi:MAG: MFS transporter [bacterium]|nr:MFS transporter [bacterium]
MSKSLQGNIWKLFVAEVTQREYYFPILTIYFLTIPDASVQQIGLWMGVGYLAEFLFEIPSGYISDRIGHKKTLLLSKLSMIAAALSFIHGGSMASFMLGAIFTAFSFAAQSGTYTAFLHETMVGLRREKSFVGIASKIFANARLVSAFLLILIPLGAQITLKTPLYIGLMLDVIGLVVVALLIRPSVVEKTTLKKSIPTLMRELRGSGFYPVIIFTSAITGFAIAQMSYIYPYMESLGFPVAFVGLIAGLRSLAQYFVGDNITKFEKRMNIKRIFLFDLVLFSSSFVLISFLDNFYIITLILIIVGGYEVGRS